MQIMQPFSDLIDRNMKYPRLDSKFILSVSSIIVHLLPLVIHTNLILVWMIYNIVQNNIVCVFVIYFLLTCTYLFNSHVIWKCQSILTTVNIKTKTASYSSQQIQNVLNDIAFFRLIKKIMSITFFAIWHESAFLTANIRQREKY